MEGCLNESSERRIKEEFEDTKGGIRIRILKKDRQHNGQRNTLKKAKRIYYKMAAPFLYGCDRDNGIYMSKY